MAQEFLRWGIIGLGSGAMNLLGGFASNPRVRVVAAADVREDALAAFGQEYGARTYTSAEEMCKQPDIDAVWVATPNHWHCEHALLALNNGKHVTVSKPMAVTLDECERMNEAADRNGVKLLAGHTQAQLAPIRKMAEVVQSGKYGKLGMIHSWNYTNWIYRPRMDYELDASKGGGVVFRQSPHHIDIVRVIAGGMVRTVRAQVMQLDPSRPAPGAFVAYLEFESGAPATIVYNGYGHFSSHEITFGRGYRPLLVSPGMSAADEADLKNQRRYTAEGASRGTRASPAPGPRHGAFGLTIATCEHADIRQSPDGLWIYTDEGQTELEIPAEQARGEYEFEEMYRAVVLGEPVVHTGRWGEATHEVTLAIAESARTGSEVRMSHQVGIPSHA